MTWHFFKIKKIDFSSKNSHLSNNFYVHRYDFLKNKGNWDGDNELNNYVNGTWFSYFYNMLKKKRIWTYKGTNSTFSIPMFGLQAIERDLDRSPSLEIVEFAINDVMQGTE